MSEGSRRRSWLDVPHDSPFSIANIPFGVFSEPHGDGAAGAGADPRCCSAIGDFIVDLRALSAWGMLHTLPFDTSVFAEGTLNSFMALGRPMWRATRARLVSLLSEGGDPALLDNGAARTAVLKPMASAFMHMPAKVGDYTDFFSSRDHATNCGVMFRGVVTPLQPNWLHLPVGYHGRASSIVVSGTEVVRPRGQLQVDKADPAKGSRYGDTEMLDFELEVGIFVGGPPTPLGRPLTMDEAEDHIFGIVLFNDWSARDIQRWEYVPLGPFTSKNFCSTVSPWVVTLEALEPFKCPTVGLEQSSPIPLEYLQDPQYGSYDVNLEVLIQPEGFSEPCVITRSNLRNLYWSFKQQIVHHTVTGCNLNPGDMFATGTISGPTPDSLGCLLELTWGGTRDVSLSTDVSRKFLLDGDTVIMRGWSYAPDGLKIGFGTCSGKVVQAGSRSSVPVESVSSPGPYFHSFKLYGYFRSSCTWRVRNALALKGIPYHKIIVNPNVDEQARERVDSVNPMCQVPVLEFQDAAGVSHRLTQSVAIIEFLDEVFPDGSKLIPHDPLLRARARIMTEICNAGMQPLHNSGVRNLIKTAGTNGEMDGEGFCRWAILKGMPALEQAASEGNGMVCVGSSVSIADCCLIPQLYAARKWQVNVDDYPTLAAIERYLMTLPAFQDAHGENQADFVGN